MSYFFKSFKISRAASWPGTPSIVQSRVYDLLGAVEAGFLDEVVPEGQSAERACALAAEFAKLPSRAYAPTS